MRPHCKIFNVLSDDLIDNAEAIKNAASRMDSKELLESTYRNAKEMVRPARDNEKITETKHK